MSPLYQISALKCSYNQGKRTVLEIDQLEFPAGQTIFIIGVSGIGKSTILETLGMMNNTLLNPKETSLIFQDPKSGKKYNLVDLWKKEDRVLSGFRNEHFSFIFQNTNLMNNLSAHENVHITQLIQGKSYSEARKRTKEILEVIGLKEINEKQQINTLSGGQRQRLAFSRAIAPDFSILFGDEPTGNLDMNNAHNLMDVLKQIIIEKQRSAIIVSHDIDLAIKYADLIIYIKKEYREIQDHRGFIDCEPYGYISTDSLFSRVDALHWKNINGQFNNESLKQKLIKDLHSISNLDK
jgi:ABC-type lipoprotein export system ATPase subunit